MSTSTNVDRSVSAVIAAEAPSDGRAIPATPSGRRESAARADARAATRSPNTLRGATASTRRQSTACRPLMPSVRVANTSARSRRTQRLSTRRVRPPVPGRTARRGISGNETAEALSSINKISSHASASSYPPPAAVPFTAAIHTWPELADASSMPLRVSFVNLQKLTLCPCVDVASIWMLAPAQNTLSIPPVTTTAFTSGCSKRRRCTMSYSSMSTLRSYELSFSS